MNEYKRLTISGGDLGFYGDVVNKCSNKDRLDIRKQLGNGKKSYEIEGYEYQAYTSEELSNIYKRLAELEDKIEQGLLLELDKPFIRPVGKGILADSYIICKAKLGVVSDCLTRAEAEAKLQELRGEK